MSFSGSRRTDWELSWIALLSLYCWQVTWIKSHPFGVIIICSFCKHSTGNCSCWVSRLLKYKLQGHQYNPIYFNSTDLHYIAVRKQVSKYHNSLIWAATLQLACSSQHRDRVICPQSLIQFKSNKTKKQVFSMPSQKNKPTPIAPVIPIYSHLKK